MFLLILFFNLFPSDYSYLCMHIHNNNKSFYSGTLHKYGASQLGLFPDENNTYNVDFSMSYSDGKLEDNKNFIRIKIHSLGTKVDSFGKNLEGENIFREKDINFSIEAKVFDDFVTKKCLVFSYIFSFSNYYCLVIDHTELSYDKILEKSYIDRFKIIPKYKSKNFLIKNPYNKNAFINYEELVEYYLNELNNFSF